MRRLIGFFIILAVAAFVAGWLAMHAGRIVVSWGTTEVETSLAFGLFVVAALVAVLLALAGGFSYLARLPARLRRRRAEDRHQKGLSALKQGMLALAAGDAKGATRHAREAHLLLAEPALTLLLGAQAAQLAGDDRAAEERFTEMLAGKDTEFLGLRGLFVQAARRGDRSVALAYLRKASELRPGTPWVINALFDLHVADGRWSEAQEALASAEKAKLLDSGLMRRRKAVLLAAEAQAMLTQDHTRALTLAEEAVRLSPALTPAAVLAARLLGEDGRAWRAQAIVENAWSQVPHPDLASTYAKLKPDESPRDRASRLMGLAERNSGHIESRLLTAQQWIGLKDWNQARAALGDLPERIPAARVATLMAEIAQGLGVAGEMHYWLDRAVRAPREPQWVCDNCRNQAPSWSPVCPSCAAFDTLSWRIRTETLVPEVPSTPTLPGRTEGAAPVPKAPMLASGPTTPRPAPETAQRAMTEWLSGARAPAERPPKGASVVQVTPEKSAEKEKTPQVAARPKPAEEPPVIFVSPRPPDDPGPDAQEPEDSAAPDRASAQRW